MNFTQLNHSSVCWQGDVSKVTKVLVPLNMGNFVINWKNFRFPRRAPIF